MVEYKTETGMSRRGFLKTAGVGALAMTMPISLLETAVNAAEAVSAKKKTAIKSNDAEKFSKATKLGCGCYGIVQQQKVGGWGYNAPVNHSLTSSAFNNSGFAEKLIREGLSGLFGAVADQYDMVPISMDGTGEPSMYLILADGVNVYEKEGEHGNVGENFLTLEGMLGSTDFNVENTIDPKLELLISADNDYKPKGDFVPVGSADARCQAPVDLDTKTIFDTIGHSKGNIIHNLTTVDRQGNHKLLGAVVYNARQKVTGARNPDFEGDLPETFALNEDLGNYFASVKSATPIVEGVQMNVKGNYMKLTIGAPKIYDMSRDTGKGKGGTGGAGGNGGRGNNDSNESGNN